jgi:hypothetical protein
MACRRIQHCFTSAAARACLAPGAAHSERASGGEITRAFVFDRAGGFDAPVENIEAVLRSAANAIWDHCLTTRFEFGFRIYRNEKHPITHYEREDEMIVIGLNTKSTYWAQYAFQFAHEFCHALMDHANDWRRLWRSGDHANQWLEESFCEVASLFALRAMGRSWATKPPYPNWSSFAEHLTEYARERIEGATRNAQKPFAEWLRSVEPIQRSRWTREKQHDRGARTPALV